MKLSVTVAALAGAASAEGFRDFLDAFNEDPKGTLDYTQDAIIRELNNDVDQRAIRLEQNQRDIE